MNIGAAKKFSFHFMQFRQKKAMTVAVKMGLVKADKPVPL